MNFSLSLSLSPLSPVSRRYLMRISLVIFGMRFLGFTIEGLGFQFFAVLLITDLIPGEILLPIHNSSRTQGT